MKNKFAQNRVRRIIQSWFRKLFLNQCCDVVQNLPPTFLISNFYVFQSTLMHIWTHIWALQIWSSGESLKRSCKMQFRRIGHRSIGPSSQKLWPNLIFDLIAPLWLQCKTSKGWPEPICRSLILKNFCVIFWPSCIHFSVRHSRVWIFREEKNVSN